MTGARPLIIAWLLLLTAALTIGGLAIHLLRIQDQNLAVAATESQRQRLATAAESIGLAVIEARDTLSESLLALPADNLIDTLETWRLDNPLVRNVFVWQSGSGLLFPDPQKPTRDEEQAFVQRYFELFAGRADWSTPPPDEPTASGQVQARRELRDLAKSVAAEVASAPAMPAATGWLPWFWGDGLHLLVWADQPGGKRCGLEIEMAALLARLVTALPEPYEAHETLALLDDQGQAVHQRGAADLSNRQAMTMAVPIGSALPHWQLALYNDAEARPATQGVLLLGGLLTLVLVVAILLGGSLLLWQARRSLRDARRKTGFVANVSHELKTPLTTIRMYSEMLEEQTDIEPERRMRYLGIIGSESRRLTRLVNNLLDFSRLEQGRKQYHLQPVDLNALLERTLAGQSVPLAAHDMTLQLALPQPAIHCHTDGDAVEQVLLNLVDNAIKYAQEGKELAVTLTAEAEGVAIHVDDHGPGVPAGHAGKIFDMFHRVDASLTSHKPGTGLGLSIARQLLLDLGGDLTFQPRPGGGSRFTIRLPLSKGAGDNR